MLVCCRSYIWNNNGDSARLVNDEGVTVSTVTATPPNVVITALDLVADNVVITNKGTGTTSLKGWKLISKTGDQVSGHARVQHVCNPVVHAAVVTRSHARARYLAGVRLC